MPPAARTARNTAPREKGDGHPVVQSVLKGTGMETFGPAPDTPQEAQLMFSTGPEGKGIETFFLMSRRSFSRFSTGR
jgi:hypothetical protein